MRGKDPGPTLVFVAAVHGNEPAGFLGLQRVLRLLEDSPEGLQGEVVGLLGNRRALAAGRRFLTRDLNRLWVRERIDHVRSAETALPAEEEELRELDRELRLILAEARGRVYLVDLHTFSAPGFAFSVLHDTMANREFALSFPVPAVLGIEEEVAGTLIQHASHLGVTAVGFEAGQHLDPAAQDRAEAVVWIALEACGVLSLGRHPRGREARRLLTSEGGFLPSVVEVRYRHPVSAADRFRMRRGFKNFQAVQGGEILADDVHGPVLAPSRGLLLMPLYQEQGEDGFFLVRAVNPAWLRVSAILRRWQLERVLHWLPGVKRHPEVPGAFVVDRRYARWLALEIFHLLGFRRRGKAGRFVVLSRRAAER